MENKLETRKYNVVGITCDGESPIKIRYATDQVAQRERHYLKFGAAFAYFAALSEPMTKVEIIAFLRANYAAAVFGKRAEGIEEAFMEAVQAERERVELAVAPKEPKKRGPKPGVREKTVKAKAEKAVKQAEKNVKAKDKPKAAKPKTKAKSKAKKEVAPVAEVEEQTDNAEGWGADVPILENDYDDDHVDLSEFEEMAQYND